MNRKIYINNLNMIYLYIETNYIYIASINNSRKKKRNLLYIYIYINNMLLERNHIYTLLKKKTIITNIYNNIITNKEIDLFKGTFYGYKSKIKIVGRGWKIIKTNYNTLLIKLGFSHPLFLVLNTFIKYKIKKKKKNIMFFMVLNLIIYIH